MKYCPLCEQTYDDEALVCTVDRSMLRTRGPAQDAFIGRVVQGRYRVTRRLGAGGMGTVYLAEQLSISRKVALKVLHKEFSRDDEFVSRFRQEARLAASLNHRSVTTIFDFDQSDDGSLFIAMEYVEGRALSEVIHQEGALDVTRALRLGIQIAEGLQAAHRAGVIHRDVKPQNIMVVGRGDEVKLMDFGIARLRDGGSSRLTRAGVMMGTPAYMAPEQIEGAEVREQADIYAFGIVLYEMLTGTLPFSGNTPAVVLTKQLRETPTAPRQLRPEVPSAVEQVIMRALEKDPRARQRDMGEIVASLRPAEGSAGGGAGLETLVVSRTAVSSPAPAPPSTIIVSPTIVADHPFTTAVAERESARPRPAWRSWKLLAAGALAVLVVVSMASWLVVSETGSSLWRSTQSEKPRETPVVQPPARAAGTKEDGTPPKPAIVPEKPDPDRKVFDSAKPPVTDHPPVGTPGKPAGRVPVATVPQEAPVQNASRIQDLVAGKLRAEGLLKTAPDQPGVLVDVSPDRVVTLSGVLSDREQLTKAIRLAKEIPGVKDVNHQKVNLREDWANRSN